MKPVTGVGLGLSLVFGCLLLALCAEIYYLLWWKRRITNKTSHIEDGPTRDFLYILCCKKPASSTSSGQEVCSSQALVHESRPNVDANNSSNKDLWLGPFGEQSMEQNFTRFLFTIAEESREDLESEDGERSRKQSRNKSFSDLIHIVESPPFLTPLASPPYFTPPLTPSSRRSWDDFSQFFESKSDAEFNRLRSSPPPRFKFLKDAEDKFLKREVMQAADQKGVPIPSTPMSTEDEENGSFYQN